MHDESLIKLIAQGANVVRCRFSDDFTRNPACDDNKILPLQGLANICDGFGFFLAWASKQETQETNNSLQYLATWSTTFVRHTQKGNYTHPAHLKG